MLSFSECKNIIDSEISKLTFGNNQPQELYQPIAYILGLGGKRIRPVLTLLANDLFGGSIQHSINPALAVEIFHNFTLLHDDIMDKAPLRRNNATVHHKWNENIAILSGDAMNIIAYQHLCRTDTRQIPALIDEFSKVALEICEGQQLDMNFESRQDVSLPEYLEMIRLKTAVLLATSLKLGAICGGAGENEKHNLYQFGLNLGLAFQIQDDCLDAFGTEEEFGKSIGGDIAACKKTYLYLKAMETASEPLRSELFEVYNHPSVGKNQKIEKVLQMYNHLKIKEAATELVASYTQKAMNALAAVNVARSKKELETLAYLIMSRTA
jgi:geranylgeranyl diphosphate synthase type II